MEKVTITNYISKDKDGSIELWNHKPKYENGYWDSKDIGTEITDLHPVLNKRIKAGTCARISITIDEFINNTNCI